MKSLTYVLKLTAIALNTYFLSFVLEIVRSGFGGHPLSLLDWVGSILVLAIPPVTLITIALTFHKKFKILTSVLRIIAIILNAHLLIPLIWCRHEILDDMALWAYLIYCGLPALNLVALALSFRKEKEKTPPEYWKLAFCALVPYALLPYALVLFCALCSNLSITTNYRQHSTKQKRL